MKFICLFFPAVIAASNEIKSNDDNLVKLKVYCKYCLYINFIMTVFLILIGKKDDLFQNLCTVKFYCIYLLIGIVLSYVLPKILNFCKDNMSIKIKRENK